MSEYQIRTIESRRFDITGAVASIEVEFHKEPRWADELEGFSIASDKAQVDGIALARYSARIALTGSALPAITIMRSPGEHIPLDSQDLINLGFLVASFGRLPSEMDYSEGSQYLALREAIEQRLDLQHIHLGIREGERQMELENKIEQVAQRLSKYSLAFSQSPELGFLKFVELIDKGGRIFTFSSGADKLLGATALASAYQLAMMSNPIIAVKLAASGASSYVVIKFGSAVGKKVEKLIQKW